MCKLRPSFWGFAKCWCLTIPTLNEMVSKLASLLLFMFIHRVKAIYFWRAISEVQDGNPTGQEMFFRVLFLPFTFIVSMRDLLVKVGAYTAVAVLPLFWWWAITTRPISRSVICYICVAFVLYFMVFFFFFFGFFLNNQLSRICASMYRFTLKALEIVKQRTVSFS